MELVKKFNGMKLYVKKHLFIWGHDEITSFKIWILHNKPKTLEQLYYRDIFEKLFPKLGAEKVIPYFWMPNFVKNATDASARTLDVYKEKIKNNE